MDMEFIDMKHHNLNHANTLTLQLFASEEQKECDWREIIYQMALDYKKYNHLDDFQQRVAKANPDLYPTGITGYEQYYIDMEGFWRELYSPDLIYDENYSIDLENNYYKKNIKYIKTEKDPNPQGQKLYYNAGGINGLKDNYQRVYYNGTNYLPISSSSVGVSSIFSQESTYEEMTKQDLKNLRLFIPNEERSLYILTDCGLKKDIQNQQGNYCYFSPIALDDHSHRSYYLRQEVERINANTTIERIINVSTRDELEPNYVDVIEINNLDEVDDDVRLYTKIAYPIYRQDPLVETENINRDMYYNIITPSGPKEVYNDEVYYSLQGIYLPLELASESLTTRTSISNEQIHEKLLNIYTKNEKLLNYFNTPGSQGLYNLTTAELQKLVLSIKKLLYIQSVLTQTDALENTECTESSERSEGFEQAETPLLNDYIDFVKKYRNTVEELNSRLENMYNDFSQFTYNNFMSEQEFINLYQNIELWLTQQIDNIQQICYLYVNKDLKAKENIDFHEFLFGPIIKFAQADLAFNYDYPEEPIINSELHKAQQLDNTALNELKTFMGHISQLRKALEAFRTFLDTHSFNPTEFYSQVLVNNPADYKKYFKIEPAMCYTISEDYYWNVGPNQYWCRDVYEQPQQLNFWIEFLDTQGELSKFKVDAIGPRQKVTNDNSVKAIYYPNVPLVIYSTDTNNLENQTGYQYLYYNNGEKKNIFGLEESKMYDITKNTLGYPHCDIEEDIPLGAFGVSIESIRDQYDKEEYYYWRYEEVASKEGLKRAWRGCEYDNIYSPIFTTSAQGKSAKDAIDELLYKHSYCAENASITTVPVYCLQPNNRIYIYDKDTGIEGEYIATQMTIPLAYNGTMSITASKAVDRII